MGGKVLYGDISPYAASTGVGGMIDGVLLQYGVYDESGLVKAHRNLGPLDNSALSGAALTIWDALYGLKSIKPGRWVLVQGAGRVIVLGLHVCSSEEKASQSKQLGADNAVNDHSQPDWGNVARELIPNQAGVDYIVDIGSRGMLQDRMLAFEANGIHPVLD
ncbi:hypothetical protein MW887_001083 [Aspergillus wentii]|nr:hypothetical protein MW887_001083 [Aspergillus wentii]